MPVEKVPGGWRWGQHGKTYKHKWQAEKQGRAIKWREQQEQSSDSTKRPWWKR